MSPARPPVATDAATLKVLDAGAMIAGPFAATLLADLGAEVIKVEPPDRGDFSRYLTDEGGYSLMWQLLGRNKRSVTMDLRKPQGQDVFKRLAQWADVVIENHRPGVMARLGLDYAALAELNPRLVYVSVSAFGQTGPYRERPGYEWVGSAFSGLTSMTGDPDRPPVLPGMAVTDHMAALFAAIGALEAVRRRDARGPSGRGTHVDVALHDGPIRISNMFFTNYAVNGTVERREGGMPSGLPGQHTRIGYVYETKDGGYVALVAATRAQFERLATAIGQPELVADERFESEPARRRHHSDLDAIVRRWVSGRTASEALRILLEADQAVSTVNGPAEVMADPHVIERENFVTVENARGQSIPMPNVVPRLREDPGRVRWTGEELGASNDDVYRTLLGLADDDYEQLARDGVV